MIDVYPGDWPLEDGTGRVVRLIKLEELRRWQDVEPDRILVTMAGNEIMAKDLDADCRVGFVAAGFVVVPQYRCTDDEKVLYLAKGKE